MVTETNRLVTQTKENIVVGSTKPPGKRVPTLLGYPTKDPKMATSEETQEE